MSSVCTTPALAQVPVIQGVPDGFEVLEMPRLMVVTVSYGGDVLGNFEAKYAPGTLAFRNPEDILSKLTYIKDEHMVGATLASPLPTHAELVCYKKNKAACGNLQPDIAGIIFDENSLSAELFISPHYLSIRSTSQRYLPLPERSFSSVSRFDGAFAGVDTHKPNYTLAANSMYSFGEYYLNSQSTLSDEGIRFDSANIGVERQGWGAKGGLFRSRSMQLMGDLDMLGISLATSLRTRMDAHKIEGNDIFIYLPRRSYVSIYREGRLYSAKNYETGNQKIDTTELPDGAYNITLRIQEPDGMAREETRFFAKSEWIPPPDSPVYYVEAGIVRESFSQDDTIPQLTQYPILRAGTLWRAGDNIGFGLNGIGISDRGAAELDAYYLTGGHKIQASALASNKGDIGGQTRWEYVAKQWYTSLDVRTLNTREAPAYVYNGLISESAQSTASINYLPQEDIVLGFRASYVNNQNNPAVISIGPTLSWRLWQEGESNFNASADIAQTNHGMQAAAMLRLSYRLGGNYGVTSEAGGSMGNHNRGAFGSGRFWYERNQEDEILLLGAGVSGDKQNKIIQADGEWRNHFGRLQGNVQQSLFSHNDLNYVGNFSFGAAQSFDALHIGGFDPNISAVAVEVQGEANTAFRILINSVPRGTLRSGEKQVLYLTPYQTYQISVQPLESGLYQVEEGEQTVTLYPGNVPYLTWHANPFVVFVGTIIQPNQIPLANARLLESFDGIATDDMGRVQAEITLVNKIHFATNDSECSVDVSPFLKQNKQGVLLVEEALLCK